MTDMEPINEIKIQYNKLSSLTNQELEGKNLISVLFDELNTDSEILALYIKRDADKNIIGFERLEAYSSLKEISTVAMKELLTLYAKRYVINTDTYYYTKDYPRLHSFLSKLTYTGIETVCKNLNEFGEQFKEGKITLRLPRISVARKKQRYSAKGIK
jgi:hypothetical protein